MAQFQPQRTRTRYRLKPLCAVRPAPPSDCWSIGQVEPITASLPAVCDANSQERAEPFHEHVFLQRKVTAVILYLSANAAMLMAGICLKARQGKP